MAHWTILTVLCFAENQRMALGKIAETIAVHPSTVGNAVDVLETTGLIRRDLPDRRTVLATLTPVGARRLRKVQLELIAARFGFDPLTGEADAERIHAALALLRRHDDQARDDDDASAPAGGGGPVITQGRGRSAGTEPTRRAPRQVRKTA